MSWVLADEALGIPPWRGLLPHRSWARLSAGITPSDLPSMPSASRSWRRSAPSWLPTPSGGACCSQVGGGGGGQPSRPDAAHPPASGPFRCGCRAASCKVQHPSPNPPGPGLVPEGPKFTVAACCPRTHAHAPLQVTAWAGRWPPWQPTTPLACCGTGACRRPAAPQRWWSTLLAVQG